MRDKEQVPRKIDMLPTLMEQFAPAHAGIDRRDDHAAQMRSGGGKEQFLLGAAENRARLSPFLNEAQAAQRVRRDESLVKRPEENMAKGFEITVHGRIGDSFFGVASSTVIDGHRFVNPPDGYLAPVRQEELEAVNVPRFRVAFGEKARGEFAEGHGGDGLHDLVAPEVQVFLKALFDRFRRAAGSRPRSPGVPHAVDIDATPINVASFVEAHDALPFCWRVMSQRMT